MHRLTVLWLVAVAVLAGPESAWAEDNPFSGGARAPAIAPAANPFRHGGLLPTEASFVRLPPPPPLPAEPAMFRTARHSTERSFSLGKARLSCVFALTSALDRLMLPPEGGRVVVPVKTAGSSKCARAAIVDDEWARIDRLGDTEVVLTVLQNDSAQSRHTQLTLAAGGDAQSVRVHLEQPPGSGAGESQ